MDNFDERVLRDVVNDFYITKKIIPTIPKVLEELQRRINYNFGITSLRRQLYRLGFKWGKTQDRRKILLERPDIVAWRGRYLRAIRKARKDGLPIFYLDETWIDSNVTMGKCWQNSEKDVQGVMKPVSGNGRLIVVHIGSQEGFLPGAALVFKAGCSSGDYHGQMNTENFMKWLTESVLPKLPNNSVVVLDNAPYHSVQINKPPPQSANKAEMQAWLARNGIYFSPDLRK